jgi:hypothetical protein
MSNDHHHAALSRATERRSYALRNLARARAQLNSSDPLHARSIRRIEEDLADAERDLAHVVDALAQERVGT